MKLKPIIKSLLETDQYKFNMQNIVAKKYGDYTCVWTFKCRNAEVVFTPEMVDEIREQVDHYCTLSFKADELEYLRKALPWLSDGYLNFLKLWHPDRSEILINEGGIIPYNTCGLAIEAHGTWRDTMMYEIAILAIVNEIYFAFKYGENGKSAVFVANTAEKCRRLMDGTYDIGVFSEFGMRRRLSSDSQDWLIAYLTKHKIPGFIGTSNVYLARKYGVKPVGTMAHEFAMAIGQGTHEYNPAYSNKFVMDDWVREYQTRNGIVLADTIGTEVFLRDFNLAFATLFSGVRHDSGDPFAWGDRLIAHYGKLGIDPKEKTLLFSDSLDFAKATALKEAFSPVCKVAFGIGTYLANDTDVEPLNIVMKLTEVNGSPVAKLSDVQGKGMCRDSAYEDYLRRSINWRLEHEKPKF